MTKTWARMTYDEKVRDVFALCREGLTAKQIGARFDIDPQHIYTLAREEGFSVASGYTAWPKKDDSPIGFTASPDFWAASPDALREAIWKRAREAARARLDAINEEQIASEEDAAIILKMKARPPVKNNPVDSVENPLGDRFLAALRQRIA